MEMTMVEPVRDYELKAFFTYVIGVLERLGIPFSQTDCLSGNDIGQASA